MFKILHPGFIPVGFFSIKIIFLKIKSPDINHFLNIKNDTFLAVRTGVKRSLMLKVLEFTQYTTSYLQNVKELTDLTRLTINIVSAHEG